MTTEVTVKYDIDRSTLPPHTDDEFYEWVCFETGVNGSIMGGNPLVGANFDENFTARIDFEEY